MLTDWEQMIPSLNAGDFDVIISGMSITPSRNMVVNFTDPYAFSGMTLLANRALTEGFRVEDFNHKDVIFTARRGATSATVIGNLFPNARLLLMDEDGADTEEVWRGAPMRLWRQSRLRLMPHGILPIFCMCRLAILIWQRAKVLGFAKATMMR